MPSATTPVRPSPLRKGPLVSEPTSLMIATLSRTTAYCVPWLLERGASGEVDHAGPPSVESYSAGVDGAWLKESRHIAEL